MKPRLFSNHRALVGRSRTLYGPESPRHDLVKTQEMGPKTTRGSPHKGDIIQV